jgi:hypothetical protein
MAEPATAPVCAEKTRLLLEYNRATEQYSALLNELHTRMGTVSQAEYQQLRGATEQARMHSEYARLALEDHVSKHGC